MKTTARLLGAAILVAMMIPVATAADLFTSQADDGKLAGWTWFSEDDTKVGDVWTLGEDGTLVCKGTPLGYIATEKEYGDFTLTLKWRRPEGKEPGKGGVLIRTVGPDKIWPKSLEVQINAGGAGFLIGLDGYEMKPACNRIKTQVIDHEKFGKVTILSIDGIKEKPVGQWNDYRIVARGGDVTVFLNGKPVNKAVDCKPLAGRIVLTSEGDEIHFKDVKIEEVKK